MRCLRFLITGSLSLYIALPFTPSAQKAASGAASYNRYDLFGGYSFLSNSFAHRSGDTSLAPLNGWDAGVAFRAWHDLDPNRPWHRLGIKTDVSGYYGTSLDSQQAATHLPAGWAVVHVATRKELAVCRRTGGFWTPQQQLESVQRRCIR